MKLFLAGLGGTVLAGLADNKLKLKVPIVIPDNNEETYVIFTNDYENAEKIRNARLLCTAGDESACNNGQTAKGSIMFKARQGKLFNVGIGPQKEVDPSVATLDSDNALLVLNNADFGMGGFWWSVYGHFENKAEELELPEGEVPDLPPCMKSDVVDDPLVYKHDKMSLVQIVESCHQSAFWKNEIDFKKFGWHNGPNGLEFNDYGFAVGDVFATCSYPSSPAAQLSWNTDEIESTIEDGTLLAKVPDHIVRTESFECLLQPFKDFEAEFEYDECEDDEEGNFVVLSPPNKLDYSYSSTSYEKVFQYFDKANPPLAPLTFSCPVVEGVDSVTVMADGFTGPNLLNIDEQPVPMGVEAEDLAFGGIVNDHLGERFVISVRSENLEVGVKEFRCGYSTQEGYVGYSRPYVLSVFDGSEPKTAADEPKTSWGEGVKETRKLKEGQMLTNVANCWQSATGEPSALQFGFRNQNGQDMLIKYPDIPVKQHAISLNMQPLGTQNQADVYCESSVQVGNETVTAIHDLGTVEVIQKPFALVLDAKSLNDQWTIDCHAQTSKYDNVEVALSLDKKFKKVIGSDGYARFNITGEFEQREQERLQSKGTYCIYTSEQFPDEKFKTTVWTITKYVEIPRVFKWGFLLMFGSLAVFIFMCFSFNKVPDQYDPVDTKTV